MVPRDRDLSALALIVFVAAIVFLPSALQLTYFRDDWYYMLDGTSAGAGVFPAMFSSDRPARGIVFAWLFTAFGADPLPYPHPGLRAAGRNEPDRLQHLLRLSRLFPAGGGRAMAPVSLLSGKDKARMVECRGQPEGLRVIRGGNP